MNVSQVSNALKRGLRRFLKLVPRSVREWRSSRTPNRHPSMFPPVERLSLDGVVPHAGHAFDEHLLRLEAASLTHEPAGDWGDIYQVIKAELDPLFYFSYHGDIRTQVLDPVGHYIRAGAKENRDPAPWFSTSEYRRKYLVKPDGRLDHRINPFYHYLTKGRAAGNAPRAPANYDIFCGSIGLDPVQTSELVTDRMNDVRARLRNGELGEMVMKASALDPLVGDSWWAGLRVRVPPASNAIGTRRIGHLLDLQHQAKNRRARVVIVIDSQDLDRENPILNDVLTCEQWKGSADDIVMIVVGPVTSSARLDSGIRVVFFGVALPRAKDYAPCRTLVEFIRSMQPETVINLNAKMMKSAMRSQGRAVAVTSTVYQYLPFDPTRKRALQILGASYYRAVDANHRVIVPGADAYDHLVNTFSLPDAARDNIWVADGSTGGANPAELKQDLHREVS